ncbi:MAG: AraC family transcriptional regulator [Planctomycetota bacterium]|nr:MAG: AraC family transcriptional regulator [Planctomycetota bacterium]
MFEDLQPRILATLVRIQSRLREPLTVESLATEAEMSASHFAAVFRGMVGESVHQHVRRLRLEWGANLLRMYEWTTERIARESGFESREAFARAFKLAFGVSPDRFRRERRDEWKLPGPSGVHFVVSGEPPQFTPIPDGSRSIFVRIVEQPSFRVAFQRYVGPERSAHRVWYTFLPLAAAYGLISSKPTFLGFGYDDDELTPPDRYRYDAAIVLPPESSFCGFGPIGVREFPASLEVQHELVGTFDDLDAAWNALTFQWLPQSDFELNGDCGVDEYHISLDVLRHPIRTIEAFLNELRVTLRIPVQPR